MSKIVIVGNGISGISTARHIRKRSNDDIVVISSESKYHYSRTALMYIYMGHMKEEHTQPYEAFFWKKNRIELVHDYVTTIDYSNKSIQLKSGEKINYDKLVLAVGSKSNKFGWPGQDLKGVQGMYGLPDVNSLEAMSDQIEHAIIVGGGLIGIELCEMLLSRGKKVTFLVRENWFWQNVLPEEEARMVEKHIRSHHVDLRMEEEMDEILSDDNGHVRAVRITSGEEIPCQFVGLAAGVSPNVDFLKGSDLEIGRGILINQFFETNIPDVYSIGDCAQFSEPLPGRKSVEQVWYTGRIQGETLAKTLTGNRSKYNPGHWFNSAKFFDIEYQTYGAVKNSLEEHHRDFYWEAEDGLKCIHIVWDFQTGKFLGINNFGVRLRHEFFEKYLNENKTITEVLTHIEDAGFDPEFYTNYLEQFIQRFNQKNATQIRPKRKNWSRILKFIKH